MSTPASRLTLIASTPVPGGPDAPLGLDAAADGTALARAGVRGWVRPARARTLCSPARAARDTAAALNLEQPTIDPALADRNHGAWTGRRLRDLAVDEPASVARWLDDPSFAPPGGDSVADLLARAAAWLDALAPADAVVAVTHPAIIRAVVTTALGCVQAAWFRLDVGHGTRTVLTRHGPQWRVALVNAPMERL